MIQLDDSTRHARAITSHRSLQPCMKSATATNITREGNIDARGERKRDDTSRKLKRRIMEAWNYYTPYKVPVLLRGAWNAQPARQWPLIKFRIPRVLSPLFSLSLSPFVARFRPLCKSVFASPHRCKFNTLIARPFAGQSFLHRSLDPCNRLAKCACINAGYTADRSVQFTSTTHSMTYNRAC